jgi:hypothetical protein
LDDVVDALSPVAHDHCGVVYWKPAGVIRQS